MHFSCSVLATVYNLVLTIITCKLTLSIQLGTFGTFEELLNGVHWSVLKIYWLIVSLKIFSHL